MQLALMGAQDVYITGEPQIEFFKVIYKTCNTYMCVKKNCYCKTISEYNNNNRNISLCMNKVTENLNDICHISNLNDIIMSYIDKNDYVNIQVQTSYIFDFFNYIKDLYNGKFI